MRDAYEKVVRRIRSAEERARVSEHKPVRASWYVWRVIVQVVRQWRHDRCPQQAAASSFQTILAVVPALAFGLAAFRLTGAMGAESALVDFLSREFVPFSREQISGQLLEFSANVRVGTLGIVGFVATLVVAFVVFDGLEHRVNHIWRVAERRPLYKRVVVFYLSLAVAPPLFGISLFYASKVGLAEGYTGLLFSALITYVAVFLLGYLLPHRHVHVRAVAVGALVNTVLAEGAKFAFTAYIGSYSFDRYSGIYGTLAVVPLTLVWVYWSWLMLYLGIEVSHAVQNFHLLEGAARPVVISDLGSDIERNVNLTTATAILLYLAEHPEGRTRAEMVRHFLLSDDCVRVVCRRLHRANLLVVPDGDRKIRLAKAAADTTMREVEEAMDENPSSDPSDPRTAFLASEPFVAWLKEREERAGATSIADLLPAASDGSKSATPDSPDRLQTVD